MPELSFTDAELDRLADVLAERVAARVGARSDGVPLDQSAVVKVPALLNVATVAGLLDVSTDTVRRRIAEGALPALHERDRVVVRADELRAYIDGLERIGRVRGRHPRARASRRYDFLRE